MTTYRLTVNSRPDAQGFIFFILSDANKPSKTYTGHLARYIESNGKMSHDNITTQYDGLYAGVRASLCDVIQGASEWACHDNRKAVFAYSDNADASVGPVLYFDLHRPEAEAL